MRRYWLSTVCFAPEGGGGDTPTIESLQAQLAASQARITELNNESKGHRLNAGNHKTEAERLAAELAAERAALGEKLTAAEKRAAEAETKAGETARAAAIRIAAKDAGIGKPQYVSLLDTSKVTLNEAGEAVFPEGFWEAAKKSDPSLFGQANTSTTITPPSPKSPSTKKATEMTPEEYRAARAALR